MKQEMYRDEFGSILHDLYAGILELEWTEGSAEMNDDHFRGWLSRFADAEETVRAPFLVIDVRRFAFRPGAQVGPWRDEEIIPRYNAAGVQKFAFLLPSGASGDGNQPAPEPPGTFPTGYFGSWDAIIAWFGAE